MLWGMLQLMSLAEALWTNDSSSSNTSFRMRSSTTPSFLPSFRWMMLFLLCSAWMERAKATSPLPGTLNNGLVAYYPFNGNANDNSGNNNDGVVHSATLTADRFGVTNSAYHFDGNSSYIEIVNGQDFNFTNIFSVSFWVNPRNYTQTPNANILSKSFGYGGGWAIEQTSVNNNFGFDYFVAPNVGWSACGIIPLVSNQWNHVAITKQDQVTSCYLNNVLLGSGSAGSSEMVSNGDLPLTMGAWNSAGTQPANGLTRYFTGDLDEIYIYVNRTLSVSDVAKLFFAPPTGQPTGQPTTQPTSSPTDTEFQITDDTLSEYLPTIATLANGGFIVTWYDATNGDIHGQLYDATGTTVKTNFQINTDSLYDYNPTVAALADGGFIVTWIDNTNHNIHGQLFAANGSPSGSEFQVDTDGLGDANSVVAVLTNGGFVVTWVDNTNHRIHGQLFAANGSPSGSEFQINTDTTGDTSPTVAALANGGFVVTWVDGNNHIQGQLFDANGSPVGSEFQANTDTLNDQSPMIAALANGGFVVTWFDSVGGTIYGRLYAANGSPSGAEFQISANTLGNNNPTMAGLVDGGFVVTWQDSAGNLYGRLYAANGSPSGSAFQINADTLGDTTPTVAALPEGGFVVTWYDTTNRNIHGQRFDSNGNKIALVQSVQPTQQPSPAPTPTPYPTFRNEKKLDLSTLNVQQGIAITGANAGDQSGYSVANVGDVNGDGKDDFIIGSPHYSNDKGRAYLIYGSNNLTNINLANLTITQGITITGTNTDLTGCAVSAAGDVNGDGKDDFLIGAKDFSATQKGRAYLIYGSNTLNTIDLASLGTSGIAITGATGGDKAGTSVSGVGDVNGDGKADFLIGAPSASSSTGKAYLIFGSHTLPSLFSLASLNGVGISISYSGTCSGCQIGASVSGAGDVNKDGKADFLIGAPFASNGMVYLIYGTSNFSNIDLNNLGASGISINGAHVGDLAGTSVSSAGDVNSDGKDDFLIGAPGYSSNTGLAYLIFGSSNLSNMNLTNFMNNQGITLTGIANYQAGFSVSKAGDVNGDGYHDIIVGAYAANGYSGISYVIYGKQTLSNIHLASVSSADGFSLIGGGQNSGYSVSGGGDINRDGYADVIVGAFNGANSFAGITYIVYGSADGFKIVSPTILPTMATPAVNLNLANLISSQGITITGANIGDHIGYSVNDAGDMNGDGKDDFIIGAYRYNNQQGIAYLIYGGTDLTNINLANLGNKGAVITSNACSTSNSCYLSYSLSKAGDVNNDGKDDLLIGAVNYNFNQGAVYLLLGNETLSFSGVINLDGRAIFYTSNGVTQATGYSVSGAGDVNGDGKDDFLIGTPWILGNAGQVFLIYGSNDLSNTVLPNLGNKGITITGANAGDLAGISVSGAGDVNGDGKDDFLIGAYGYSSETGIVYLIYGGSDLPATLSLGSLGSYGISLTRAGGIRVGWSVSSAGDMNGDGKADILIAAPLYSAGTGASYLIYGNNNLSNINLGSLGNGGITIAGANENDATGASFSPVGSADDRDGYSISSLGDINRDGYDDIAIGASGYSSSRGIVYIIYGKSNLTNINLASLSSTQGISIIGANNGDQVGYSVHSAGDVNGDGKADLIIGAPNFNANRGGAYLIYGASSGLVTSYPTSLPSGKPSCQPTDQPTGQPTAFLPVDLKTGLIAYYPFDGDANDNSGNNNDGVVHNATLTTDRFGVANKAYSFNGINSYIVVTNGTQFDLIKNEFTVSLWINAADVQPNHSHLFSQIVSGNAQFFSQQLGITTNTFRMAYTDQQGNFKNLGMFSLPNNTWAHVVYSKQNEMANCYLNNVLILTVNMSSSSIASRGNQPLVFGARVVGAALPVQFFNGSLSQVMIYNRALSPAEISELYNFDAPTSQPTGQPTSRPTTQIKGINNGLVADYPFNGNANDASGNGNNGVVNAAVLVADRFGNPNSAYHFNGASSYIAISGSNFNFVNSMSLSFWINPASIQPANANIMSNQPFSGVGGWWIRKQIIPQANTENNFYFDYYTSLSGSVGDSNVGLDGNNLQLLDNTWNHVVITKQNADVKYYLNGVLNTFVTLTSATMIPNTTNPLLIGARSNVGPTPYRFFNGSLDDIKIYNRTLSEEDAQILFMYDISISSLEKGLVAYYPFTGNANDKSGNGNNAITNTATLVPDRFGNPNSAYRFDGSTSYIELPGDPFNFVNDMSISIWVNPTKIQMSSWSALFHKMIIDSGSGVSGWYIILYDNTLQLYEHYITSEGDSNIGLLQMNPDAWNHCVVTKSGVTVNWYINGILTITTAPSSTSPLIASSGNLPLIIGAQNYGQTIPASNPLNFFTGLVDDIYFYNRTLSSTEVAELFTAVPALLNNSYVNPPTLDQQLEDGLIAYFPLNGNAKDASGYNHATTVVGATLTADQFGNPNSAYHFASSSYIQIINSALLEMGTNDISFTSWVNIAQSGLDMKIYSHGSYAGSFPGYMIRVNSDGKILASIVCSSNLNNYQSQTGNAVLNVGTWYFIANTITRNGDNIIYINSEVDSVMSGSSTCDISGTDNAFIGTGYTSNLGFFEQFYGNIEEVRIYNKALSAEEIRKLYHDGSSSFLIYEGLVAYYPFNGNANDASVNGNNNGIVHNATLVVDRFGYPNSAYHFDGATSYIEIPGDQFNFVSNMSISCWFNPSSIQLTYATIFDKSHYDGNINAAAASWWFFTNNINNEFSFNYMISNSNEADTASGTNGNNIQVSANSWQHISIIKQDTIIKYYLNGMLTSSLTTTSATIESNSNLPLLIGAVNGGFTTLASNIFRYYNGLIDDIFIYNRTLSSYEVQQLYTYREIITAVEPGLVAYFPFNGNANDASGNNHLTTVVGATLTTDRFGNANSAYYFTSTSYIQIANSALLEIGTSDYSITAWVKLDQTTNNMRIYTHGSLGNVPGYALILIPGSELYQQFNCIDIVDHMSGGGSTTLNAGTWYFVANTVVRGANGVLYINAVADSTTVNVNTCDIASTADAYIGSYGASGDQFHGSIDEVRIYNKALSAKEVQQLYMEEAPSSTLQTGLVAYYPFSNNANDASGNGNNGVVYSATLTTDRFGNPNSAYSFDGSSSYIELPGEEFNFFNEMSVSFWINPASSQTVSAELLSKSHVCPTNDPVGPWYIEQVANINNQYNFGTFSASVATQAADGGVAAQAQANTWNHIVYTKQNAQFNVYLNGALVNTTLASHSTIIFPTNPNLPLTIGAVNGGCTSPASTINRFFNGIIDDIFIYNRALTDTEIMALYTLVPNLFSWPAIFTEPAAKDLAYGLAAYYSFNGNANDVSGNGNNPLTNTATLAADRFGNANSAYYFNGNSAYIEYPGLQFNFINNMALSFWINPASNQNAYAQVLDKSHRNKPANTSPASWFLQQNANYNNQYLFGYIYTPNSAVLTDTLQLTTNEWTHFIVSKQNNDIYFYLNGELVFTFVGSNSTIVSNGNLPLLVGALNSAYTLPASSIVNYFTGYLDEIRIYSRALTPGDVKLLYEYGTPTSSLQQGLVAYYPFSGDANDKSGKGNNGVVYNALLATDRFGIPGNCYSFDGSSSHINLPGSQFNFINTTSISFWVNPASSQSGYATIFDKSHYSSSWLNGWWIGQLATSNNKFCFVYAISTGNPDDGACAINGDTIQTIANSWNHVVITKQSKTINYYLNGALVNEATTSSSTMTTNGNLPLIIGAQSDSTLTPGNYLNYFKGTIDDIFIYNRTLSATEVTELYSLVPDLFTWAPTSFPTSQPSGQPSRIPTSNPSSEPSDKPSGIPSRQPTNHPSGKPTGQPTSKPSDHPTAVPSGQPTNDPSADPTTSPSGQPSSMPTSDPSSEPSSEPSTIPSSQPTNDPSSQPTSHPSGKPTTSPSGKPTNHPSVDPTTTPSGQPSSIPTSDPSSEPSSEPSTTPSSQPTSDPSEKPTGQPTSIPSGQPTTHPSADPSTRPSEHPSGIPTSDPSSAPSDKPSSNPSKHPSGKPTGYPSSRPSRRPTGYPSRRPSSHPSRKPTTFVPTTTIPTMTPSTAMPTSATALWSRYNNTLLGNMQLLFKKLSVIGNQWITFANNTYYEFDWYGNLMINASLPYSVTAFTDNGNDTLIFAGEKNNHPPIVGLFDRNTKNITLQQALPLVMINFVVVDPISHVVFITGVDANQELVVLTMDLNQHFFQGFSYTTSFDHGQAASVTSIANSGFMLLGQNKALLLDETAAFESGAAISLNNNFQLNINAALPTPCTYSYCQGYITVVGKVINPITQFSYAIIDSMLETSVASGTSMGYICNQPSELTDVSVSGSFPSSHVVAVGVTATDSSGQKVWNNIFIASLLNYQIKTLRIQLQANDTVSNCTLNKVSLEFLIQCFVINQNAQQNVFFVVDESFSVPSLPSYYQWMNNDVKFSSTHFSTTRENLVSLTWKGSSAPSSSPSNMPTVSPSGLPTSHPSTAWPTGSPSTSPTESPSSSTPTGSPSSSAPTTSPTSSSPSIQPSISVYPTSFFHPTNAPSVSQKPTTLTPTTHSPTTRLPSMLPTIKPSATGRPSTEKPTTRVPSAAPTTQTPTTHAPTSLKPTQGPSMTTPTQSPSTKGPSQLPVQISTSAPSIHPTICTFVPTVITTVLLTQLSANISAHNNTANHASATVTNNIVIAASCFLIVLAVGYAYYGISNIKEKEEENKQYKKNQKQPLQNMQTKKKRAAILPEEMMVHKDEENNTPSLNASEDSNKNEANFIVSNSDSHHSRQSSFVEKCLSDDIESYRDDASSVVEEDLSETASPNISHYILDLVAHIQAHEKVEQKKSNSPRQPTSPTRSSMLSFMQKPSTHVIVPEGVRSESEAQQTSTLNTAKVMPLSSHSATAFSKKKHISLTNVVADNHNDKILN